MNRIRTLDGLRGLAILMVVAGHAVTHYPGLGEGARGWFLSFTNPGMGVRLFFALSGYLITELLLREQESDGSIHLGAFYLRRARRILPALYVFLILLALWLRLVPGGTSRPPASAWFASATFTWNYSFLWTDHGGADLWNLGHTWSLAVEAQFYLLWPLLLVRLGQSRALLACLGLLLFAPVIRLATYALLPGQRGLLGMMLHTGYDGIVAGCAAALLCRRPAATAFLQRHAGLGIGLAGLWVLAAGPVLQHQVRGFSIAAGFTLDALAAAWLVAGLHRFPPGWGARLLGSGLMPALGAVSYSLYLWQQVFLSAWGPLGRGYLLPALAGSLAAAGASYWLVERPFLRSGFFPRPLRSSASHLTPT